MRTIATKDDLDPVWKALADSTRRQILDLLRQGGRTTGAVCSAFPQVSRISTIKHLRVLEEADLVVVRPRGRERWNYLNPVPLQQIYERWMGPYQACWASALLNLRDAVESREVE